MPQMQELTLTVGPLLAELSPLFCV